MNSNQRFPNPESRIPNPESTNHMILSIDVEDYYMVTALSEVVKREHWDHFESRVERSTYRLLKILDECKNGAEESSATFFCLGCVAERYPHLIREIHNLGFEIASHGYDHQQITKMTPAEFREDIRKSKAILENITGEKVLGYRAPSYSITEKTLWALEILIEEGFFYDSSIFPVHHDHYGIPNAPRSPFVIDCKAGQKIHFKPLTRIQQRRNKVRIPKSEIRNLIEFPITTLRIAGQNLPVSGGGYFRFFPLPFTRWALNRIEAENSGPVVFYLHPWEIDADQPRLNGLSFRSRFRHYLNLNKTATRLQKLLGSFTFTSFKNVINGK